MTKESLLQEIIDFGIPKNSVAIFEGSDNPDKLNLTKESGSYQVFYLDEKGAKSGHKEFQNAEHAKEYLIDLFKVRRGDQPFFAGVLKKEDFEKKRLEISEDIQNSDTKLKDELLALLEDLEFNNDESKNQLKDLLMVNGVLVNQKIADQLLFFLESLN